MFTSRRLILIATFGSAALLLGALYFQYFQGLAPCKMCIWQRWPHGMAIALGLAALVFRRREIMILAGLVVIIGAGIGLFHAGVEQNWWEGPNTCTSGSIGGLSTEELLDQILAAPVVRCDEIVWSFIGLTMAAWNAVISSGLAGVWLLAAKAR